MDKNFSTFLDSQYELLKQIVDKKNFHSLGSLQKKLSCYSPISLFFDVLE